MLNLGRAPRRACRPKYSVRCIDSTSITVDSWRSFYYRGTVAPNESEKAITNPGINQFRLIVEAVLDYAIFMLDPSGRVVTWNLGAQRIKGYKESEIVGKHFSVFYPESDVRAGKPEWELEVAQREGRFEDEGWRIRKDGTRFWANVIITALRTPDGHLLGYGKVTRDFTERKRHEQELADSEQRFRLLVEGVPDYALYLINPEGHIVTWNSGAERIKGYKSEEIIGKDFSTFFTKEDIEAGKPQAILERAAKEGRAEHEGWRIRKDGSKFWVSAVVTALHDKTGNLIGFSKITRDITERMEQREALKKSEEALRTLSVNLLRTQDEERRRIGREMHDSLGQYLSALKMKLGTFKHSRPNLTAEDNQELTQWSDLLEECVKEVRTISYLLYPPMLEEMGLKSAIAWYLDGFKQRSGIETTFEAPSDYSRLSKDIELALFRVVQEGLNNVHKHSGSKRVNIQLSRGDGTVAVAIRDYGKGLPLAILEQSGNGRITSAGVGLRGMYERVEQLGGELKVSPADPGVILEATVPVHERSVQKIGFS
jgi:PAS domain S-box-containing protein